MASIPPLYASAGDPDGGASATAASAAEGSPSVRTLRRYAEATGMRLRFGFESTDG
ncbi:MAG: hypothetical protein OXC19_05045 [Bryobacterales bacterium]|nr:hypothetical protein [Bryobacterales bacterium]